MTIAEVARRDVQVEIVGSAMTWIMEAPEDEAEGIEGAEKGEESIGCKFHPAIS